MKLILLIAFYSQFTFADIAILSSELARPSFHQLLATDKSQKPYSQQSEESLRAKAQSYNILDEYRAAKSFWLSGNLAKANETFTKIIDRSLEADWLPDQHQLILFSYIGIAELVPTQFEKRFWIKKALAFSVTGISSFESISPEIKNIILTESQKPDFTGIKLSVSNINEYGKILVNGIDIKNLDLTKIPLRKENYRITLLSDSYLPVSEIVPGENINKLIVAKEPAVMGSCEFPIIHQGIFHHETITAVYENGCYRKWNGGWLTDVKKEFLNNYNISAAPTEPPQSVYQKPWLWGALAVGAIILLSEEYEFN